MVSQTNNQNNQIKRGNLNDPREFNRLLMQYGGIFKNNIKDFAQTIVKVKKQKNFSR